MGLARNKSKSSDKLGLGLKIFVTVLVLATAVVYIWSVLNNGGNIIAGLFSPLLIIILVLVLMTPMIISMVKDMKHELPIQDEMSKELMTKSSSIAFFISIYYLLAIAVFEDRISSLLGMTELIARHAVELGIMGMAIIFAVTYFIVRLRMSKK